jgi:hypothetical protein
MGKSKYIPAPKAFWFRSKKQCSYIHTLDTASSPMHRTTLEFYDIGVGCINLCMTIPADNEIDEKCCLYYLKKIFNPMSHGKHLNICVQDCFTRVKKERVRFLRFQHLWKDNELPTEEKGEEYVKAIEDFKQICLQYR